MSENKEQSGNTPKIFKRGMWKITDGYYVHLSPSSNSVKLTACCGLVETKKIDEAVPFVPSNKGYVGESDIARISSDIYGIFDSLRMNGFIDGQDFITEKFCGLNNAAELKRLSEVAPSDDYFEKISEIYDLLRQTLNKVVPKRRCPFPECQRRDCLDTQFALVTNFGYSSFVFYTVCKCVTTGRNFVFETTIKDIDPFKNCVFCGSGYIKRQGSKVSCGHCLSKYLLINSMSDLITEWRDETSPFGKKGDNFIGKAKTGFIESDMAWVKDLRDRSKKDGEYWSWPWVNILTSDSDSKETFLDIGIDLMYLHDIFLYRGMPPIGKMPIEGIIDELDSFFAAKEYCVNPPQISCWAR